MITELDRDKKPSEKRADCYFPKTGGDQLMTDQRCNASLTNNPRLYLIFYNEYRQIKLLGMDIGTNFVTEVFGSTGFGNNGFSGIADIFAILPKVTDFRK